MMMIAIDFSQRNALPSLFTPQIRSKFLFDTRIIGLSAYYSARTGGIRAPPLIIYAR